MTDLTRMTAAQLANAIKTGETSAVEVATAHLDRIEAGEHEAIGWSDDRRVERRAEAARLLRSDLRRRD